MESVIVNTCDKVFFCIEIVFDAVIPNHTIFSFTIRNFFTNVCRISNNETFFKQQGSILTSTAIYVFLILFVSYEQSIEFYCLNVRKRILVHQYLLFYSNKNENQFLYYQNKSNPFYLEMLLLHYAELLLQLLRHVLFL